MLNKRLQETIKFRFKIIQNKLNSVLLFYLVFHSLKTFINFKLFFPKTRELVFN